MIKLLFCAVIFYIISTATIDPYTIYLPIVNANACSEKSGVALGSISEEAFENLCLSNWYEYNLIIYDRYPNSQRFYVYWCDEYISPRNGRTYIMRQQMLDNHPFDFDGYIIFFNEWGYPGQCDATDEQYIAEFQWLKEHYPYVKIIIGNTFGHDHLYDYGRLKYIHDIITEAGYDWSIDIYGIGIHDYTIDNPQIAIEKLRELQLLWGTQHPVYVTEFVTDIDNIDNTLNYYEQQEEIKVWFWFLPCNPLEEYRIISKECNNILTPLGERMYYLNRNN